MPAADLRFGDVIKFAFGDATCVAMVIATKGDEVTTDENIYALGNESNNIVVLGLVVDSPYVIDWHKVGETAAFPADGRDYKVLERELWKPE